MDDSGPRVIAVSRKATHGVAKLNQLMVRLVAGHGVEGDAHYGVKVQHRSRARQFPDLENLRQVHLLQAELLDELAAFRLAPGEMGENLTTRGIDLLGLPRGARLRVGAEVELEITGLRNPCVQLDGLRAGLMAACLGRGPAGEPLRKAGVMAVVRTGGEVWPGDSVEVLLPDPPHAPLRPV